MALKLKETITLCFAIVLCHGCAYKYYASESSMKFPYDNFNLHGKINIDGFYESDFDTVHFYFCRDGGMFIDSDKSAEYCGLYEFRGDTLRANVYSVGKYDWISFRIYRFEILNDTTLKLVDIIDKNKSCDMYSDFIGAYFKFHKTGKEPSSKDNLKKKKWMWKNKEQWKAWMKDNGYPTSICLKDIFPENR